MPKSQPEEKPLDFTLMIRSLNASMRTRENVAQALEGAARVLREFASTPRVISASIHDVNGNSIGSWRLVNAVEDVDA